MITKYKNLTPRIRLPNLVDYFLEIIDCADLNRYNDESSIETYEAPEALQTKCLPFWRIRKLDWSLGSVYVTP